MTKREAIEQLVKVGTLEQAELDRLNEEENEN